MKKSTVQTSQIRLPDALKTRSAGASLRDSLYSFPVTILLTGELGAGKTTFLQGFAEKLGISEPLTSPTYALEQRYKTKNGTDFLHLDLYRLKEKDAAAIIEATEDHTGIRCIEWADRLPEGFAIDPAIRIHLEEAGKGRLLSIEFDDMKLPSDEMIEEWRKDVLLPAHIAAHCDTVAGVAETLCDLLIGSSTIVRKDAVIKAARVHDLLRFFDFKTKNPTGIEHTQEQLDTWTRWKEKIPATNHEDACAFFLREEGFPELATIVETHGLRPDIRECETTEQRILFYADKRVIIDRIATIDERFEDFKNRYAEGKITALQTSWYERTKKVESELFPEGPPSL
jgi:tRNA threonylcarbamoyladenosine biosynthesis protein TsaE